MKRNPRSERRVSTVRHTNCLFAALVAGMSVSFVTPALAQVPSGATVRAGSVSFAAPAANQVVITQSSAKAVIDWRTFSIGAGNSVQFIQPNASAIALNRVTGSQASLLQGSLSANGQVWLLNPNGVFIGAGGQINSAGFLGTTRALSDSDFLAGRYRFTDSVTPGAAVINLGTITATNGGYAVLAGEQVRNEGLIQANLGSVVLGGAKTFVMDVVGDKLLSFQLTGAVEIAPSTPGALVDNSGRLIADGGQVLISARALKGVIDSVINTTGLVQANSTRLVNGVVTLDAGDTGQLVNTGLVTANNAEGTGGLITASAGSIVNTGTLSADGGGANGSGGVIRLDAGERIEHAGSIRANASTEGVGQGGSVILMASLNNPQSTLAFTGSLAAQAGRLGGDGGFIETSASQVNIGEAARVSTAAAKGLTGNWLIDPNDFTIAASGGNITGILLGSQLGASGVTISTATQGTAGGNGDIFVLDPISWASSNRLTLRAGRNIFIDQPISATASSGSLALEFGQLSLATGNLAFYSLDASVNLQAGGNFSTKRGSDGSINGFTVITTLGAAGSTTTTDLQGIGGGLSGRYALGANIAAASTSSWNSGAGFLPIGDLISGFSGTFDGLGHVINN
ncbi:MAG: filamentous hemagglutinin N-terminal domain-containing protein, partial [Proteobacteria bacterium]|nr:filamentous hemagglutinin N-terminal domain-containing protein [Pseudomonadota bacterium]